MVEQCVSTVILRTMVNCQVHIQKFKCGTPSYLKTAIERACLLTEIPRTACRSRVTLHSKGVSTAKLEPSKHHCKWH